MSSRPIARRVKAASRARNGRARPGRLAVIEMVEGRVLFSVPTNPSFDAGPTPSGWTINASGGPGTGPVGTSTIEIQTGNSGNLGPSNGNRQLRLRTPSLTGPAGWTSHTSVVRSSTFTAEAGETLRVDWRVVETQDDPIAKGFLRRATDGSTAGVFFNGQFGGTTPFPIAWATAGVTVPTDGSYYLEFQGGSVDATRGGVLGADMFIDNIRSDRTLTNVSAGGPYTISEGGSLSLSASATSSTGGAISYTWDLNGDGSFGDASGQNPVLSWSQLNALGINDGPSVLSNVRVRAADSQSFRVSAPTTLTVNNAPPTATLINTGPVLENSPVTVAFVGTGDPSVVDGAAGLRYFTSTIQTARDAATYSVATPSNDFSFGFPDDGSHTVYGRVLDKDGGFSDYQTVVTVNNANPVAINDAAETNEDVPVTLNVTANDSDRAGSADPLSVVAVVQPANGAVTINGFGSITYAPNADFYGTDTFNYTITDGDGGTATGSVAVTVKPVNDAPSFTAGPDQAVAEDAGPQTVAGWASALSAGPANEAGQALQFEVTNDHSALFLALAQPQIDPAGTLRYTPAPDANGVAYVTVRLRDNGGTADGGSDLSASRTFKIVVNAVNDAPVAADDVATTDEDTPLPGIDVLANDRPGPLTAADEAGQSLAVTHLNGVPVVAGGDAVPTAHGSVALNADRTVRYAPAPDYNGPDGFTYTVADDGDPRASSGASGFVAINAVNDRPVAADAAAFTDEDTAAAIQLHGADGDPEVTQALTYHIVSGPTHGAVSDFDPATGSLVYTPNANYHGPDAIRFTVTDDGLAGDPAALTSDEGVVTLTVRPVNDAPVALADEYAAAEDTPLTVYAASGVLANDDDVDGDLLRAVLVAGPNHGQVTLRPDGSFTYAPALNYHGPDEFTYQATDGRADSEVVTVSLAVEEVNDAPSVAADAAAVAVAEGGVATNTGTFSDVDGDSVTLSASAGEVVRDAATGTWAWSFGTADGPDDSRDVTITADDGRGGTATTTFALSVTNVAPSVAADEGVVEVDEGAIAFNAGTWSDPGADAVSLSASVGAVAVNEDGTWSWSYGTTDGPDQGQTVTIRATDSDGAWTETHFDLIVRNVAPTLTVSGDATVEEGGPYVLNLASSDPGDDTLSGWRIDWGDGSTDEVRGDATSVSHVYADGDGDYEIVATATDEDGTYQADGVRVSVRNVAPTIQISGAATVEEGSPYSLTLGDVTDPGADTVSAYVVHWGDGSSDTYSAGGVVEHAYADGPNHYAITVDLVDEDGTFLDSADPLGVNVTNVAPAVAAGSPAVAVNEGETAVNSGTFSDPGDDAVTISASRGTVTQSGGAGGTWSWSYGAADGPRDGGPVTITATDSDGDARSVTFDLVVNNVAPAPSIDSVGAVRVEGTAVDVVGSATDPAGANDTLTYAWAVYKGASATAFATGGGVDQRNFSFTPDDDGSYRIVLTVSDEDGGSTAAEQTVTVANLAPAPSIVSIGTPRVEGTAVALTGAATDPAGANDTVALAWAVYKGGETQPYATGTGDGFDFTPDDDGPYRIVLTATDEDGGLATAERTVTVDNVAPAVNAGGDAAILEGGTFAGAGSFADPGADSWTATVDYGDGSGVQPLTLARGTFTLGRQYADNGTYTVTVTVRDEDGGVGTDTLAVTVANVAPTVTLPAATNDATGVRGQARSFAGTIADPGFGPTETFTVAVAYGDGTGAVVAANTLDRAFSFGHVYTGAGTYTVTVTVTDDDGASHSATHAITVSVVELQGGDLVVGGTTGNDTISFNRMSTGIAASLNGALLGVFKATGRLIAYGQAGDDILQGTPLTTLVTELYGGAGNDRLVGGAGPSLLVGGEGNDNLTAGSGRSVQVGGTGADILSGASADDLLIGDDYLGTQQSLRSVLARWADPSAANNYAARRTSILPDLNAASGVKDDGATDVLTGNGGTDWFFSKSVNIKDTLKDLNAAAGEVLN